MHGFDAPVAELSNTSRQIVMLPVVEVAVQPTGGGGSDGGKEQKVGFGGLELGGISAGLRLEASSTAEMALTTVVSAGKSVPFQPAPAPHAAQVGRAAVTAPCCAACVMVE